MRELGFPGWATSEDETEVETLSSTSGDAEAQTFTHAPTVSLNPNPDVAPSTPVPALLPLANTRANQPRLEISPTLPFTGGRYRAKHCGQKERLFDPNLDGECVFQAMLFLGGFATSWNWCTCARGLVSDLWLSGIVAPHRGALLNLFIGTQQMLEAGWVDPVVSRRWGCLVDITILAIAWNICLKVACDGVVLASVCPPCCDPIQSTWAVLGFDGQHYWVEKLGRPVLKKSVHVPDLTEEGIEPNPGPAQQVASSAKGQIGDGAASSGKQPPTNTKATNKRKAAMVKQLLQLRVDFTAHQLRTLVNIDGACERLESAKSDQQRRDLLNSLYSKSGFKKEAAHPEAADELPSVSVQVCEDLEIGFQLKPSLCSGMEELESIEKGQARSPQTRAKVLRVLQQVVHPVAQAASTGEADTTLVNDAVVVKVDSDYIAGRCWVTGDILTVLGLSGAAGIFFNPPLATQMLYRVSWMDGKPADLFKEHQTTTPQFAGIVMAKDRFGVRTKVLDTRAPGNEEWEIRGLPLRLNEKAIVNVLTALGISGPTVRRELQGWRLVLWDKYPVPPPLALDADQAKHKVKTDTDTFVVWFRKCGGRQRSKQGTRKISRTAGRRQHWSWR
eukprot:6463046-Amphidinium_carterae.1